MLCTMTQSFLARGCSLSVVVNSGRPYMYVHVCAVCMAHAQVTYGYCLEKGRVCLSWKVHVYM